MWYVKVSGLSSLLRTETKDNILFVKKYSGFTVHCTVYKYAVYTVQFTNMQCTLYSLQICSVHSTVYKYAVYTIQFTNMQCTLYSLQTNLQNDVICRPKKIS